MSERDELRERLVRACWSETEQEEHHAGQVWAGMIHDLECQPRYRLEVNGVKICDYVGDFRYTDAQTGAVVVEDVKGGNATKTPVYRLKRRLMLACHGIEVVEIEA